MPMGDTAINLDRRRFGVAETAAAGVVSAATRLELVQRGSRLLGRYAGGPIERGRLVGDVAGGVVRFRYAQREAGGEIHGGRSVCDLTRLEDGRLCLTEHFTWETRAGSGVNAFVELGVNPVGDDGA